MTREEIIAKLADIIYEEMDDCDRIKGMRTCEYCRRRDEQHRCIFGKYIATKLAEIFTKHETDLLKEFVEWYKKVLEQDYDDKANRMNKTKEETDWWFFNGQCTAIHRLITLLDSDLEKFLEERTNERNQV